MIVAATSDFICQNNGNIVHADQHVDSEQGIFLQRIEWDWPASAPLALSSPGAFRPIAEKLGMQWELRFSDYVPRTAIFVSKLEPLARRSADAPRILPDAPNGVTP